MSGSRRAGVPDKKKKGVQAGSVVGQADKRKIKKNRVENCSERKKGRVRAKPKKRAAVEKLMEKLWKKYGFFCFKSFLKFFLRYAALSLAVARWCGNVLKNY